MQTAIIYVSVHHGNTRRVAEAMAEPLGAALFSPDEAMALDTQMPDFVGFGSGIYFGRHHGLLFEVVRNVKPTPKHSFVFSTAGIASLLYVYSVR